MIRQEALCSLAESDTEDARQLLIRVARQPGPSSDSNQLDRQQTQEEKLIAIRALSKHKHQDSVQTLQHILENERDVALRDNANDAFRSLTGKNFANDAVAWRNISNDSKSAVRDTPNVIQQVAGWVMPKQK